jgi:hypothetical protein
MAFSGQVLYNPVSGERFVFHTTAGDGAGKLLEFDLVVEPHGLVPGGHVHPGQHEIFEVPDGIMKFHKSLCTVTAGPGSPRPVPGWRGSAAPTARQRAAGIRGESE